MTLIISREMQEVEVTSDVTCNRCGKSTRIDGQFEGINFHVLWGYPSRHDLEQWSGDMCQGCSEEFDAWIQAGGGKIDKMICTVDGEPQMTKEEYERKLEDMNRD